MRYFLIQGIMTGILSMVPHTPSSYDTTLASIAKKYQLNPAIFKALARVESNLNPKAINLKDHNGKGSHGLYQLRFETAQEQCGIKRLKDLYNASTNAKCAAIVLKKKLTKYGNYRLALAAYNAGKAKYKNGQLINKHYVDKVLSLAKRETL